MHLEMNADEKERKLFWSDVVDPPSVLQVLLLPAEGEKKHHLYYKLKNHENQ